MLRVIMAFLLVLAIVWDGVVSEIWADPAPSGANGAYLGATSSGDYLYTPRGFCTFTVTAAAVALSTGCSIPVGARTAFIATQTAAVNYRTDGVAPTAAIGGGMPLAVSSGTVQFPLSLHIVNLGAIQFIAQTGTATITVDFYQ